VVEILDDFIAITGPCRSDESKPDQDRGARGIPRNLQVDETLELCLGDRAPFGLIDFMTGAGR
jgi:hypothetical protein